MLVETGVYGHAQHRNEAAIAAVNGKYADSLVTVELETQKLARRVFWQMAGLPDLECRQLAEEIPLPTAVMERELEIFDPSLPKLARVRAAADRLRERVTTK